MTTADTLAPVTHLVLYQFPPVPGAASVSPFCMKVHYALKWKGLPYEVKNVLFPERITRESKLPVLGIDGEKVLDSSVIMRRLETLSPASPFFPQGARERAEAALLEDWADETLYWYAVYFRWMIDDSFARMAPMFDAFPWWMRPVAKIVGRGKLKRQLRAAGIGRRSREVVTRDLEASLVVLDGLLDGRAFLVGDAMTSADLSVVAQLQAMRIGITPDEQKIIDAHRPTRALIERVLERCAP